MKLRFQADNDLNQIIIKAIQRREPAIDFRTPQAAGLTGLKDEDVLSVAAREKRLLVTHDRRTIPHHFAEFIKNQNSPGVLIVPQSLSVIKVVDDIILIWLASEDDEWINRIHILPL